VDLSSGEVLSITHYRFWGDCGVVSILMGEMLNEMSSECPRRGERIVLLNASGMNVKRFDCGICRGFWELRSVILPPTLRKWVTIAFGAGPRSGWICQRRS
jgi:hypothetical protein